MSTTRAQRTNWAYGRQLELQGVERGVYSRLEYCPEPYTVGKKASDHPCPRGPAVTTSFYKGCSLPVLANQAQRQPEIPGSTEAKISGYCIVGNQGGLGVFLP